MWSGSCWVLCSCGITSPLKAVAFSPGSTLDSPGRHLENTQAWATWDILIYFIPRSWSHKAPSPSQSRLYHQSHDSQVVKALFNLLLRALVLRMGTGKNSHNDWHASKSPVPPRAKMLNNWNDFHAENGEGSFWKWFTTQMAPAETSTFSNFNRTIQGRMRTEVSNFVRDFSQCLFREGLKNEGLLEHWTGFQCLELLF